MNCIHKEPLISKIGEMYRNTLIYPEYKTYEISPTQLNLDKRIDIIIKLICIPQIVDSTNLNSSYLESLYKEHIKCITQGSFKEAGSDSKHSFELFKDEFKDLCLSISKNGFDEDISLVPVTSDFTPINGAHRIATALYYGVNIKIVVIPEIKNVNYGLDFFRKRYLDERFINSAIIKLFEISDKYVLGVTWPASNISPEMLSRSFSNNIIDIKTSMLTREGCHNIVCEAYSEEAWLGTADNNYNGAWGKVVPCLGNNNNPANFFILKLNDTDSVIDLKESLRTKIGIGKHSIHICDDNIDSLPLLKYIYNINFEKIVNNSHYKYTSLLKNIDSFSSYINKNDIKSSDIIFDSSALLGVLGLREPRDLDYLSFDDKNIPDADWHINYLKYHNDKLIDLLLDPQNHIYVYGYKFISPSAFKAFKKNRNEKKDKIDLTLLSSFEDKSKFYFLKAKIGSEFIYLKYKIRVRIIKLIDFLGIKNYLKKLLRK